MNENVHLQNAKLLHQFVLFVNLRKMEG